MTFTFYLFGHSNVTGMLKLSAQSTAEMCNILQNSLSLIILSKQRKITPLSAPDHRVNLPGEIKNTLSRKIINTVIYFCRQKATFVWGILHKNIFVRKIFIKIKTFAYNKCGHWKKNGILNRSISELLVLTEMTYNITAKAATGDHGYKQRFFRQSALVKDKPPPIQLYCV